MFAGNFEYSLSVILETVEKNHKLLTALQAQMVKLMALGDSEAAAVTALDTTVTTVLIPAILALQAQIVGLGSTPTTLPGLDAAIAQLTTDLGTADTDAAPATPPAATASVKEAVKK